MLIHEPIAIGAEQDIFVTSIRQDNQSIAKTVRAQNKDFSVILEMGENVFSAPRTKIWANYFVRKRQFKMTERMMDRLFKF
jgi:endo-alpha-1,4-polygalactosaminidase (GH114 family)